MSIHVIISFSDGVYNPRAKNDHNDKHTHFDYGEEEIFSSDPDILLVHRNA